MCKYTKIKKKEAVLACVYLMAQPMLTSRMIKGYQIDVIIIAINHCSPLLSEEYRCVDL